MEPVDMTRFLAHMFVVSVLSPALGGAIYNFFEVDWHDSGLLPRLAGSILGGFVLLAFIWFWTIPLGLVSYACCLALSKLALLSRTLWALGGLATGSAIGGFLGVSETMPLAISLSSGVAIGVGTGLWLRELWAGNVW
jgi:hypothetical protein